MLNRPSWIAAFSALAFAGLASAQTQHSLVIGIDGLGYGTQGLDVASTPNIDSLINGTWQAGYNGAYADNAFAGGGSIFGAGSVQATSSGPGWSTVLTGVWVDQHSVSSNSFSTPDFQNNKSYLETLEENIAGIHTASIINWSPIDTHVVSTVDDASSSMDFRSTPGNDNNVTSTAVAHIGTISTNAPSAVFVHFDEVDGAGHGSGSGSVNYANEITDTDGKVGQLLAAVSGRANFANEDWQIIVISDHGHKDGGGHGGQSTLERTIPFLVASSSAVQGNLLGLDQAVSQADVAPTVLNHFGIATPDNIAGVSRDVPEPASAVGLVVMLGALTRRRR